ncbi:hypothetical protein MAPG_03799 [Magnaporthiopsis poae ATCC 64411]|uniref:Uncharacterized protein n=1 Tax=Magnaporthiopsis poae (strain ATCC 64411 / 73-15) TaxID=644358 RepID=A0A0C4DV02_MAGP6|nr:hypothetical protein MAPG_03799 [Magnaporthiopsis poae ATCC 64411]
MKSPFSLVSLAAALALIQGAVAAPAEPAEPAAAALLDRDNAADVAAYEASLAKWKADNNWKAPKLSKRYPEFSIYTCENSNWVQPCWYHEFDSSEWNQMKSGSPTLWTSGQVRSVGPGTRTTCILYTSSGEFWYTNPGSGGVNLPGPINNWKCFW